VSGERKSESQKREREERRREGKIEEIQSERKTERISMQLPSHECQLIK